MLFFFFQSLCSGTDIIAFSLLSHIIRPKDHRRMSEGSPKESRRAGAAEYVTKDKRRKDDVSTLYLAPLKYCIPFGRPKGLCLLSEYYTQGGRIG